jgi:L-ascorbate metabolism protein UlaG (beta-lactamase superfamily)
MKITWQGHACFYVESSSGMRIVTDPYTPSIAGLAPLTEPADIVVMSSDNDTYHSDGAGVPGNPVIVNALAVAREGGSREVKGVTIRAIEAMESLVHKTHPDNNALYRFAVDGVEVGHMGDVGNPLSLAQMEFFRGVDVLLALTGGPPTIELDDLDAVIREVQPKIVIPMHYRILQLNLNIFALDAFTSRYPAGVVDVRDDISLDVSADVLPMSLRIVALQARATVGLSF